jgi:hypothetical protein
VEAMRILGPIEKEAADFGSRWAIKGSIHRGSSRPFANFIRQ